ncbi:hypothetical protein KE530_14830 [Clostridiaceae bacterium Marseille-Q4145]|nr:hypothetical protein [Clostridiaceae bacterium Marseille-Q4145]
MPFGSCAGSDVSAVPRGSIRRGGCIENGLNIIHHCLNGTFDGIEGDTLIPVNVTICRRIVGLCISIEGKNRLT